MSDEDEFTDEEPTAKDLRKRGDKLASDNKALLAELAQLKSERRTGTVAEILKAKGVPASAAKFYDKDDVSEDAVGSWLEEHADIFGVKSAVNNDENANAARDVSRFSGSSDTGESQKVEGGVVGDPNEMLNAMRTFPYEELVKMGFVPPK